MSQMSGEVQFGWMKMLRIRSGPAEVRDDHEAGHRHAGGGGEHPSRESGFSALIPNTSALEAIMRPPADRPMKKAKVKMYMPQDTTSRMPVEARPF